MSQALGQVVVVRPSKPWRDRLRRYRIEIDGVSSGTVRAGKTVTIETSEGPHVIQARIDWTGSPKVDITVTREKPTKLVVRPAGRGGSPAVRAQLLGRETWLILEPLRD
jgi:hypothetical protein